MNKFLTVLPAIFIIGAIGALAYVVAKPNAGERFTEFYLLGAEGKAENYPKELALGEKAKVLVGIVNREGIIVKYRLEVRQAQFILAQVDGITLDNTQKWQSEVEFALTSGQGRQKVDFWLYREGDQPYLTLYLWVEVKSTTP